MFESRISEDADGERRIMGSGRREEDGDELGIPGFLGRGRPADTGGSGKALLPSLIPGGYCPVRERLRPRNVSATFRTCEKSYINKRR